MLTQDDTDRMILPLMPVLMGANGEKVEVPSLAEWLGHLPEIGVGGGCGKYDPSFGSWSPSLSCISGDSQQIRADE